MKNMKKKKKNQSRAFGLVALGVFVMATMLMIIGFSVTLSDIDEVAISRTPEAILANAGVSEEKDILLPVAYFDQKSDQCVDIYDASASSKLYKRQFEWSGCGYHSKGIETGLVEFELSDDYLPVAVGGKLTPNRGLTNLDRWFEAVDGKSASYTGNLKLDYTTEGAEFSFYKARFYPLDEVDFSKDDFVNNDGHNHLFTMSFAVPFTALFSGNEEFEIVADDDTFVYVGNKLVIDMGGIHDATSGRFVIHKNGEIYTAIKGKDLAYSGVTIADEEGSIVRIYHADRDADDSTFGVVFRGMNLGVTNAQLADSDAEAVQIAYDPTDPTYVAPLGESSVVEPNNTRGFIVLATIEGLMVIVFSVLMAASIRSVVRRRLQK